MAVGAAGINSFPNLPLFRPWRELSFALSWGLREHRATKVEPEPTFRNVLQVPVFDEAKLQKGLIPAAWLISGDPETRSAIVGKSADGMSYVMIWECGAVSMRWHYHRDEAIVVLDGEAFVTDQTGLERRYGSGDVLLCPRGTQLRWRIPDKFRKIALLKINVPRPLAFAARVWNRLARSARSTSAS